MTALYYTHPPLLPKPNLSRLTAALEELMDEMGASELTEAEMPDYNERLVEAAIDALYGPNGVAYYNERRALL